jgi:hypothetical protein
MGIDVAAWDRIERLVDSSPSLTALRVHRLQLIAADLWRRRGQAVPPELREDERRASLMALAAPVLLERARAAYDGQLVLMKGPEAASQRPDPGTRYFRDLDLLAENPAAAQAALIGAGFVEVGEPSEYATAQHLCPLAWPGLPLVVELHREPNRPPWLPGAPIGELLTLAVPSATGITGLRAPSPAAHALLLAAHAWTDQPFGRLSDVVDIAAVLSQVERGDAYELARGWGWERLWQTTISLVDGVLIGGRQPRGLSTWARHLSSARDRSVLEDHIARIAGPACAVPRRRVPAVVGHWMRQTATPRNGEPWPPKLRRAGLAVAHAFTSKAEHDKNLCEGGR